MSLSGFLIGTAKTSKNTAEVAGRGTKTLFSDPQILLYPLLAGFFILLTLPVVNGAVFGIWDKLSPHTLYTVDEHIPHKIRIILGIVTFSYFYTTVVTTYFVCAVSASVLHKLDGHPTTLMQGLRQVGRHFLRVTHFAVLAIFFTPLAIIVQWRKLPRGFIDVLGSALSLHTAQMAPAILNSNKSVSGTIRDSINTLGKLWKEGLIIKICSWLLAIALAYLLRFLPGYVEDNWFDDASAHWAAWLTTTLLLISIWVLTKVLSAVFVSVLYHKASRRK